LAVSPEPKRRSRAVPAREAARAGRARVKRELLAETNGPHTTSELSLFLRPYFFGFWLTPPLSHQNSRQRAFASRWLQRPCKAGGYPRRSGFVLAGKGSLVFYAICAWLEHGGCRQRRCEQRIYLLRVVASASDTRDEGLCSSSSRPYLSVLQFFSSLVDVLAFGEAGFRFREHVGVARNPDIKRGQQEDAHDQGRHQAAHNYDGKRTLRVRADGVRHRCG